MATSPVKLQQGYGIGNALQNLAPFSIIANRVPTQSDKARIGTFWVYTGANNVYVLSSVTGGLSNWLTLSNGGAGVFMTLTVNGNITQTAGVTSLLATTTTGLTNNGVFNQTGNTVINACPAIGALNVLENVADTAIYTQSDRAGGSRHLLCRQTSTDAFPVYFTTVKSRNGAVVNPLGGDILFQQNIVVQGSVIETETARIVFTAGIPLPAPSSQVPSSMDIVTTDINGVGANRLTIDTFGTLSIGKLRIIPVVGTPAPTVVVAVVDAYSVSVRFNNAAGFVAAPGALLPVFTITNAALTAQAAVLVTIQTEDGTALSCMLRVAQVRQLVGSMEIYVVNDAAAAGNSDCTRCIVNFIVMTP